MTQSAGRRNWFHNAKGFSPFGILCRAAAILIVFAILHAAGLREYAAVISGTIPVGPFSQTIGQVFAISYILFYLGAVILAPILIIGSLVLFLLEKRTQRRGD